MDTSLAKDGRRTLTPKAGVMSGQVIVLFSYLNVDDTDMSRDTDGLGFEDILS